VAHSSVRAPETTGLKERLEIGRYAYAQGATYEGAICRLQSVNQKVDGRAIAS